MPGSRPSQGLGRSDARAPDTDMVMIQDMLVRKDNEIRRFIDDHIARHQAWNRDWVDLTWRAITPPLEDRAVHGFRTAITEPFPTPPESVTSEVVHESVDTDEFPAGAVKTSPFGPSNQPQTPPPKSSLSFRRRIGRGGRLMVDRRGLTSFHEDVDNEWKSDRWKYDNDSEDVPGDLYKRDFYDNMSTRYRMFLRTPQSRESSIVRDAAISSAIQSARTASDSSARPM